MIQITPPGEATIIPNPDFPIFNEKDIPLYIHFSTANSSLISTFFSPEMPKGHRSVRSQGYYRLSPVSTPSTLSTQYAPISARQTIPNTYYNTQGPLTNNQNMSQQSYTQGPLGYSNGGPVQLPLSNQQYTQMPQPISIRASSGAWTPQDDDTLMQARAQGMNWAPIQQSYFPTKTPNACRKRHERLMERRSADDWDGLKLENLAKNYMSMRREIWSALAAQTGEKWNVVEQKVCILLTPILLIINSLLHHFHPNETNYRPLIPNITNNP